MTEFIPFPIKPPPGIVKTDTPKALQGRWIDCDKIRFKNRKPIKIGGWESKLAQPLSGPPRGLHAWRDNNATEYIAAGTYKKAYVISVDFVSYDVTPYNDTGTLTNPFWTTSGSKTVAVHDTAHGRAVGDAVHFSGATASGGITVNGEYVVDEVQTVDIFKITHSVAASSTVNGGGGSVDYSYEVNIGTIRGAYGLGYGVGGYGEGGFGVPRTASTLWSEPRIWSFDHFGQILLGSYNVGGIYYWDPSITNALTTRLAIIADAPTDVRAIFVTPERFVVALCENMKVKWCSQGDYTAWTPTPTNTANIRTVTEGTKLVGGVVLGDQISLFWSDTALYVHQYTGSSTVFDTRLVGKNCGLISPSARVSAAGMAFWMSHKTFFMYNGSVQQVPNVEEIRTYVFDALDPTAGYLCAAMYSPPFNEVWFFYVEQGSVEPGRYVILSLTDYSLAVGSLNRVAGAYFQHGDVRPYWCDENGQIFIHESGSDADGVAMDAYITLAPYALESGRTLMRVEGVEADIFEQSGEVSFSLSAWDRIRKASDTPTDVEDFTVSETGDPMLEFKVRARYVGMTVRSNTLGGHFEFGEPVAYVKGGGR